ncbi:helix-turn-helix domain-containing protein [Actinomadura sp. 21ATH]|uniref:helix-turn-helix domain-containing protein n=1 Tax=Actinomadura sp. 21ATH TaxID=1735444 RepID=UPI0035BF6F0A
MRLRYRYRLYPTPAQQQELARAFGCARVVFNDGLRARRQAYAEGVHDRDVNAARNILAAGRADRRNACGALMRPDSVPARHDEAGTHSESAPLWE